MPDPAGSKRTLQLDPTGGGFSFPRLLFALLRQRFTGTLTATQAEPPGERTVWFRGGMPVFTDWSSSDDLLGELMLHEGIIDTLGHERGLAALRDSGGHLGEILLKQGLIDERQRTEALREQCSSKVAQIFAPDALGSPAVTVTVVDHDKGKNDELAQVNVLALILRGVEEHYGEAQISLELGDDLEGDLAATPALARYERQFGFEPDDAPILGALGRGVTLQSMMGPGVDRARALNIIYTLWCCQMLRVGDDAVQAIAKGATAAGAGHQLGANLGPSPSKSSSRGRSPKASASQTGPAQGAKAPPPPSAGKSSKPPPPPAAKPAAPPAPKPAAAPASKPPPPPAAKPAAPKPDPAAEDPTLPAFMAQLAELETRIAAEANAFVLFGLEIDADRKQIREVWAELSKTFHPDALEGLGRGHLHDRVEPVFAALSEAYGILGNKDERAKLASALEAGGKNLKAGDDAAVIVRNAFEAEIMA
ncbi:MAG: hypothetical protein KC457_26910, partial [Myxococcales bacterium]|nr:hypothetical protein [Myxococcales bacterium]